MISSGEMADYLVKAFAKSHICSIVNGLSGLFMPAAGIGLGIIIG